METTWCADHCNENEEFYCFSQSNSFASVKKCGKEPEKQQRKQQCAELIQWNFLKNLFCFHQNFCLRNGTVNDKVDGKEVMWVEIKIKNTRSSSTQAQLSKSRECHWRGRQNGLICLICMINECAGHSYKTIHYKLRRHLKTRISLKT